MTIVLREVVPATVHELGSCGRCRVSLCEIVAFLGGGGALKVVWLPRQEPGRAAA